VKASSEASLNQSSYQKTDIAFKEKSVLAPLARMESFPEIDDEQEQEQVMQTKTEHVFVLLM